MSDIDCAVIGAGVVGLACARALALAGLSVAVFERNRQIGQGISSRSSEVIHAGLYAPSGTLKARLCTAGCDQLYAYCAARGVPHARLGKLIVATAPEDLGKFEALALQGRRNGVSLEPLDAHAALALEPALRCVAALYSPATGIVDSHALMHALADDAQANGALLLREAPMTGGSCLTHGVELAIGGRAPYTVQARWLVNAAGQGAQQVASSLVGFPGAAIPPLHRVKGHYFALQAAAPFKHLVYPIPEDGGLGIHLTLDLAGRARFGPDVLPVDVEDYEVPAARAEHFLGAIRRYWPDVDAAQLVPDYAGIRPKLTPPKAPAADFRIDGPSEHGRAGILHLFGIESPGLTAALAIADHVARCITA